MHSVTKGYEVHGIEILDKTYDVIASGDTYFHEPGLDELKANVKKFFLFTKKFLKMKYLIYLSSL